MVLVLPWRKSDSCTRMPLGPPGLPPWNPPLFKMPDMIALTLYSTLYHSYSSGPLLSEFCQQQPWDYAEPSASTNQGGRSLSSQPIRGHGALWSDLFHKRKEKRRVADPVPPEYGYFGRIQILFFRTWICNSIVWFGFTFRFILDADSKSLKKV